MNTFFIYLESILPIDILKHIFAYMVIDDDYYLMNNDNVNTQHINNRHIDNRHIDNRRIYNRHIDNRHIDNNCNRYFMSIYYNLAHLYTATSNKELPISSSIKCMCVYCIKYPWSYSRFIYRKCINCCQKIWYEYLYCPLYGGTYPFICFKCRIPYYILGWTTHNIHYKSALSNIRLITNKPDL